MGAEASSIGSFLADTTADTGHSSYHLQHQTPLIRFSREALNACSLVGRSSEAVILGLATCSEYTDGALQYTVL